MFFILSDIVLKILDFCKVNKNYGLKYEELFITLIEKNN